MPFKPLTLRMDHAKLLDVRASLPVSHAILPLAVCFARPRPANMQYVVLLYDWRESCLLIGPICLHKSLCLP